MPPDFLPIDLQRDVGGRQQLRLPADHGLIS
jgi:hypothetical protein